VTELVASVEFDTPSLTVQPMLRLPAAELVELKLTESSADW
jgi:hypothetical protein